MRIFLAVLVGIVMIAGTARAQTDEIQVYTAEVVDPGTFGLTWHNNYIADGRKVADNPGGIVPHHVYNGVPELAYGVTDWFEVGTYLPVYSVTGGKLVLDSIKLRALFVVPHAAERDFFYGVNFELSRNWNRWDPNRMSGEIRPIIGTRFGPVDVVLNPILDTNFDGLGHLDFAPSLRVAYNVSPTFAVALEHYADFGELRGFSPADQQDHSLFGVVDFTAGKADIEFGVGHGFTPAGDKLVMKLMLAFGF
ncbi:MAG: hypothetical protein K1X51_16220 [Rhodospirillaceae bacterium]|nr:hypothetical protein [Rhodospirillaceae bacterium]